jgi:hypothetical protein
MATHVGGGAVAAAVGAGHLWIAYYRPAEPTPRNTGELVGYDPLTGRADVIATIGGAPVAVAVSGSHVWVADGVGDGSPPVPSGASTVVDLTASGQIIDSVPLSNPLALAAVGNAAWVYSSQGQRAVVTELAAGRSSPVARVTLPGESAAGAFGANPLMACGANVYAVSTGSAAGRTYVSRLGPAGASTVATAQAGSNEPSLACGPRDQLSVLLPGQSTILLAAKPFRAVAIRAGPSAVIADSGGQVWLVDDQAGSLSIARLATSGQVGRALTQRTTITAPLVAADTSDLWVVLPAVGSGYASVDIEEITSG